MSGTATVIAVASALIGLSLYLYSEQTKHDAWAARCEARGGVVVAWYTATYACQKRDTIIQP